MEEGKEKEGGKQRWEIIEPNRDDTQTKVAPKEVKENRAKQTNGEKTRRSYYMVETPEDSPGKGQEIITIQTDMSPLLQKVNFKRKHDEDSESEGKEMEIKRMKRQKQGMIVEDRIQGLDRRERG